MKQPTSARLLLAFFSFAIGCSGDSPGTTGPGDDETEYSDFFGLYLGQSTPGTTPVRFAAGILLASETRWWHDAPAFSPSGQELLLSFYHAQQTIDLSLELMELEGNRWTMPRTAPFSGTYRDNGPRFSVTGDRVFFTSRRSGGALWVVSRETGGWSAPSAVSIPGTSSEDFVGISLTRNETVYFGDVESGHLDLFRSSPDGGQYGTLENLGSSVNSDSDDWGPYVDPDEDFLIFSSNRPGGFGFHDLYISFRNQDGSWTPAENMGATINTANEDFAPLVTPDGSYLFYLSQRSGDAAPNPYWISSQFIETLRPEESNLP